MSAVLLLTLFVTDITGQDRIQYGPTSFRKHLIVDSADDNQNKTRLDASTVRSEAIRRLPIPAYRRLDLATANSDPGTGSATLASDREPTTIPTVIPTPRPKSVYDHFPNDSDPHDSDRHDHDTTSAGSPTGEVPYDPGVFGAQPDYSQFGHNPDVEKGIYEGKYLTPTQRPWIELGRGLYRAGEIPPSETWMGKTNLVAQHFLLYGDLRSGVAYNQNGGNDRVIWANRLNLDLDWKITSTERVHAFIGPIDRGPNFTRVELNNGNVEFIDQFDQNFDTIFFEGDLGALYGGWAGIDPPFDLPFTAGLLPLFYQNGYWIADAFVGAAATIPAKNSAVLDWSNFDITYFVGFDELDSPAFLGDDSAARVYGTHAAIDAYDGYLEAGYAFLDDQTNSGLSYHNVGVSFTKRYFHRVSNSIRFYSNVDQDRSVGPKTASGQLIVLENALISHNPTFFVPYLNLFAGFGSPQSIGRAAVAGGILNQIGINFETDGLTGYPLMDDTANNTFGGAMGINVLGPEFDYQLIVELAAVQTFGTRTNRRTFGDQYGAGMRYQQPLNHAWIWRMDAMYVHQEDAENLTGIRTELRHKF